MNNFFPYDFSKLVKAKNQNYLYIAKDQIWANYLKSCLQHFSPQLNILHFPNWETLPYDNYAPQPDLISLRVLTLSAITKAQNSLIIIDAQTIAQKLCPLTHLDRYGFNLKIGDILNREDFIKRLIKAGYQRNSLLAEKGEYAERGEIVDLFPMGFKNPLRIEWFDDEIETLRSFDLTSQTTLEKFTQLTILPASELDLSASGKTCFKQKARDFFGKNIEETGIYQSIREDKAGLNFSYYLPLFFDEVASFFDYLPPNICLIGDIPKKEILRFSDYYQKRYQRLNQFRENSLLPPKELWLDAKDLLSKLETLPKSEIKANSKIISFSGNKEDRAAKFAKIINKNPNLSFNVANVGLWAEKYPQLKIELSPLKHSFETTAGEVFIAEADLADEDLNLAAQTVKHRKEAGELINDLSKINVGDPVVHSDYGIGRYAGLEKIEDEELFTIEYKNSAKLYVGISQLNLVSKFGGDPENAPLHELGAKAWKSIKKKAEKKIADTATELLEIAAKRANSVGLALICPAEDMEDFKNSFAYEETGDQSLAISQTLEDLANPKPMDRIICGDVGFGKTEIAMRAAFAAVMAGYQVALIAPTTLLAQQHFYNFLDRFSPYPIKIELLSRFRSPKEQKLTVENLKNGTCDIVIGTHRLLNKDINFKNLALLIVDEEQRFGVKHKESLKKLKADVNLLTLTATPIPRTLNLAMTGFRDLSLVMTAPKGRLSVQTQLCAWDVAVIEEACVRELNRGGQIFFLHNDVETMEKMARLLTEILPPTTKITMANGQMPEKELEQVMNAFYNRHFDVLLTTTIIESGIDIPNANTIIINRADKLGLAQLHQLRGRVGRSHHQAYAYLITPPFDSLNKNSQRRLEAFCSFDSLGAGFILASQDLEIRGAGEILGAEQSGQISEIGSAYYLELLEKATKLLKEGESLDNFAEIKDCEVDLGVNLIIPADLIPDPALRLDYYQRIARAKTSEKLAELKEELFNSYPVEKENFKQDIKNLLFNRDLTILATDLGLKKIALNNKKEVELVFKQKNKINPQKLALLMQNEPHNYRLINPSSIARKNLSNKFQEKIAELTELLSSISNE